MIDPELRQLFAPPGAEARTIRLRLVRKRGEPLLLMPRERGPALTALGLYPAQTALARAARALLGLAVRVGVPLPEVGLDLAEQTAFGRFLGSPSTLAVAFGNPRADGRRFLILTFDRDGQPRTVVKAGVSEKARALISAEAKVLGAIPAGTLGVPVLRGTLAEPSAFALDFVPGVAPRGTAGIEPLLTAWLDRTRRVPLCELPGWRGGSRLEVCPALSHGDFAPWNVREYEGRWTLIDWERGELSGVPGWDWLHFIVQRAVLVERLEAVQVRERITTLLRSAEFLRYAEAAGFAGSEELIARGYVHHCAQVLRPTERAPVFAELAKLMPPPE